MNQLRALLLLALLSCQIGCALLPHRITTTTISRNTPASPPPTPKKQWHLFPHFSLGLPFFHHKLPPPRAQALQRVGVIKTVSADGSFVIIELEPCTMIPPGRDLIVTAGGGNPIHLQAAESQPPYFIADVKNGHPTAGQIVFQ